MRQHEDPESFHVALDPADPARIIGFVNAGATRHPELPFAAELYAIYLLASFHGHGAGAALFGCAARDQLAAGRRTLMLWVLRDNPSIRFYEHLGGRIVSSKRESIGGASLEELALGWDEPTLRAVGNRAP